MSLSRLLEITNLLLINKTLSAKYLADYFGVSTRTIYRDIDKLTLANIPIYANKGKNGGFSLLEDYTIDRQMIDKEDQMSIIKALNENPLIDNIGTLNKLSALFDIDRREWIQVDFKLWGEIDNNNVFDELKQAILENKEISFMYYNSSGEKSKKNVYPYKIYFKSFAWYLVGYDVNKKEYRVYKITRLNNLKILDFFDYDIFKNINEDKLFISRYEENKERVIFKIAKDMAFRVYDEFKENDFEEYDDYFLIDTTTVIDNFYYSYLLSFADKIEIIEPIELKVKLKEILQKMIEKIE